MILFLLVVSPALPVIDDRFKDFHTIHDLEAMREFYKGLGFFKKENRAKYKGAAFDKGLPLAFIKELVAKVLKCKTSAMLQNPNLYAEQDFKYLAYPD